MPAPRSTGGRDNRLRHAIASGGLARLSAAACSAVAIPIVVRDLGASQFGVYALLTGLAALLPFADLGVGLSLVTRLAHARALGDDAAAMRLTSSAVAVTGACALMLAGLAVVAWGTAILPALFGFSPGAAKSGNAAAFISVLSVAALIPASLGPRVFLAVKEQRTGNLWQAAAGPLALAGVAVVHFGHGDLVDYVAATQFAPVLVSAAATGHAFGIAHPELRPRTSAARAPEARILLSLGGVFAFQGLAMALGYQTDLLVLSHMRSLRDVAAYGIGLRFATLITIFASAALVPLWPVFAEAIATDQLARARRLLRQTLWWTSSVATLAGAALVTLGPYVIRTYTGAHVQVSHGLLLALSGWCVLQALQMPFAILLNAAAVSRFQVWTTGIMGVTNIGLSIIAVAAIGTAGPAWASAVSVTLCLLIPYGVYSKRVLNGSSRKTSGMQSASTAESTSISPRQEMVATR